MSLFQAREWWSTWCGSADEEFDQGSLCIANIDNSASRLDKIIVGSLNGVLRIFVPKAGEFRPDNLMLEVQLSQPILQVEAGKFVSGTDAIHLAVLHPKKLSVYSVTAVSSSAEYGFHFSTALMYEHNLDRMAANMTYGEFGGVQGRDFICVQSMDGMLTFFEQETYSSKISLPNFLLPGPIVYLSTTDSFVTVSCVRQVEVYKYRSLAAGNMSTGKTADRKPQATWTHHIGEHALSIKFLNIRDCPPFIMILGERSMFCLNESGDIKFMKKFEFNPSCFLPYSTGRNGVRTLVGSHTNSLLVYETVTLSWTARLPHVPVACCLANFEGLDGVTVTLDEFGQLYCSYLGTDPSLFTAAPVESREMNIADIDREMAELQKVIRESQVSSDVSTTREKKENIMLSVTVPDKLDPVPQTLETLDDEEAERFPSATVKLTIVVDSLKPIEDMTITTSAPFPLQCNQSNILLPIIGDKGPSMDIELPFFTVGGSVPSSLTATVMASYMTPGEAPRVAQISFELPFQLICAGCPPVKHSKHKITIETNKESLNLAELFPEMVDDAVIPIPAVGFQLYGGPVVSVLSSKSNNRYRLQCDVFEAMWLVLEELLKRMEAHFKRLKEGTQFKAGFTGPLPLNEYFELIDSHFEHRVNLENYKEMLAQRAHQFRVIQIRLLTRFKDKTPSPMANLDVLLDGTYKQLLALGEACENAQMAIIYAGSALSSATRIINFLIKLWANLSPKEVDILEKCLTPEIPESPELGWEEMVDANITFMLKKCLAKSTKEQNVSLPPFAIPKDTSRLKKHIALFCDRINKGGKLSLDASINASLSPRSHEPERHDLDTVAEDTGESSSPDLSPSGSASTVTAASASMNLQTHHRSKKDRMMNLSNNLEKRLHIKQDSVEAEAVRSAVQKVKSRRTSSGTGVDLPQAEYQDT